ncbi:MAG: LptA/OstA family protein [Paracoccaceae bacterium]
MKPLRLITACFLFTALAQGALAQGAQIPFGGMRADTTLPVEIAAERLEVVQQDGAAVFSGNVVIGQGAMRLAADQVRVEYAGGDDGQPGAIARLHASGNVTLANGDDAAEADEAEYTIESGRIVMTGGVLLTQGPNALSAERLVVDLQSGTGTMEGGVRTILMPGRD